MFLNNFSVRILPGEDSGNGYVYLKDKQQYSIKLKNNHDVDCQAKISIDGKPIGVFYIKAKSNLEVDHPINDDGKFTFYKTSSIEEVSIEEEFSKDTAGLIQVEFVPFKTKEEDNNILKSILKELENQRYFKTFIIHENYDWWRRPYRYYDTVTPSPYITYTTTTSVARDYDKYPTTTTAYLCQSNVDSSGIQGTLTCSTSGDMKIESGGTLLSGESDIQYKKEQITAPKEVLSLIDESNRTVISLRLVFKDEVNYNKPRKLTAFANPIPAPID